MRDETTNRENKMLKLEITKMIEETEKAILCELEGLTDVWLPKREITFSVCSRSGRFMKLRIELSEFLGEQLEKELYVSMPKSFARAKGIYEACGWIADYRGW